MQPPDVPRDFKSQNRTMQELVRELKWLREHNLRIKPGDAQDGLLLFAEAAVTLLVLEHFLLIVLPDSTGSLPDLLRQAVEKGLLRVDNMKEICKQLGKIRGALAHGNFQQRAKQQGTDAATYFAQYFAKDIEELYNFTDYLMRQIDVRTGKPLLHIELNPSSGIPTDPAPTRQPRRKRPKRPSPSLP